MHRWGNYITVSFFFIFMCSKHMYTHSFGSRETQTWKKKNPTYPNKFSAETVTSESHMESLTLFVQIGQALNADCWVKGGGMRQLKHDPKTPKNQKDWEWYDIPWKWNQNRLITVALIQNKIVVGAQWVLGQFCAHGTVALRNAH